MSEFCDSCFYCEPILNQCGVQIFEGCGECSNSKSINYCKTVIVDEDSCFNHLNARYQQSMLAHTLHEQSNGLI